MALFCWFKYENIVKLSELTVISKELPGKQTKPSIQCTTCTCISLAEIMNCKMRKQFFENVIVKEHKHREYDRFYAIIYNYEMQKTKIS